MTWLVLRAAATAGAAILTIWANWEYLREVRAREAHPRLTSWCIWLAAMTTGAVGAAQDRQWPAAALGAAAAATCACVVAAGWRHGDRGFGSLDAIAALAGSCGVILLAEALIWPDKVPMSAAIAVSVATDLVAFVPTFAGARAGDEVARPYVIFAAGAALALAASDWRAPSGVIYPAYEAAACALAAVLAVGGKRRAAAASLAAGGSSWQDDGWVVASGADGWGRHPLPVPEVHH